MKNTTVGFLSLLGCAIIFGVFAIFIRLLSAELDPYQQIAARNTIGFVVAIIIVTVLKSSWSFNQVERKHVLLYALSYPLVIIFYTLAVTHTKIGVAIFATYTGSLPTAILIGILVFHESMTRTKAMALGLVFLGLVFFVYPSYSTNALNIGFFMGLLSGVVEAISNFYRKFLAGKIDRFMLVAIQLLGGLVIAGILMAFSGSSFTPSVSLSTVFVAFGFGVLIMLISFLLLIGFQNFDLGVGTLVISSEIFFGTLFAFLVFHEVPDTYEFIGGLLIVLAVIVLNYADISAYFKRSVAARAAG